MLDQKPLHYISLDHVDSSLEVIELQQEEIEMNEDFMYKISCVDCLRQ